MVVVVTSQIVASYPTRGATFLSGIHKDVLDAETGDLLYGQTAGTIDPSTRRHAVH